MRYKQLYILLPALIMLNCAHTGKYDTRSASGKLHMKRAEVTLKNGIVHTIQNCYADLETGRIIQTGETREIFSQNEVSSLRYSNSHMGVFGALGGIILGLITMPVYGSEGHPNSPIDSSEDRQHLIAILFTTSGGWLGYKLGSNLYINWQEFDLKQFQERNKQQ